MRKPTVDIAKFATPCGTMTCTVPGSRRSSSLQRFRVLQQIFGACMVWGTAVRPQVKAPWMLLPPNSRVTSPEFVKARAGLATASNARQAAREVGSMRPKLSYSRSKGNNSIKACRSPQDLSWKEFLPAAAKVQRRTERRTSKPASEHTAFGTRLTSTADGFRRPPGKAGKAQHQQQDLILAGHRSGSEAAPCPCLDGWWADMRGHRRHCCHGLSLESGGHEHNNSRSAWSPDAAAAPCSPLLRVDLLLPLHQDVLRASDAGNSGVQLGDSEAPPCS